MRFYAATAGESHECLLASAAVATAVCKVLRRPSD